MNSLFESYQHFFDKNTTLKIEEDGSSATITLFAEDGTIDLIALYVNSTITVRTLDYLGARTPAPKVIEAFTAYCSDKIQALPEEWHRAHKAMYSGDHSTPDHQCCVNCGFRGGSNS